MSESAKQIGEYAIGDEMWRHVEGGGTFHYIVQGVRQYEGEVQLEVECQTCSHGWKCRVLLARDDRNRIVAVHLLNDDEEDSQHYWHSNDGLQFWPTREQAREEGLQLIVRRVKERIREQEERLVRERKYLQDLEAAIEPKPAD